MAGYLLEGDLYVDLYNQGQLTGLKFWEGVAKFAMKPNSELKEQISKGRNKYGQIVASVPIIKPTDFNLSIQSVTPSMLASALQGTVATLSQSAGTTATDFDAVAKKGCFIDLGKRNLTNAVVVKNTAGTTTYVNGTDYKVNFAMGFVEILATGAITEGQALKISYGWSATTGNLIQGGTKPLIRAKFVLDGVNLNTGKNEVITVWEAAMTSDSEIDFMADDFISPSFTGRMVTPDGKASPFEIEDDMTYVAA